MLRRRFRVPGGYLTGEEIISIEIIALIVGATFFFPRMGQDLIEFYLPLAQGCLTCGFNPWHASWIFAPLQIIPPALLLEVWTFVSLVGLYWAAHRLQKPLTPVLLTFPLYGMVFLGQTDAVVAVGLVMALTLKSPYWRGLGLLLASVKPHIAGIAILILIWHDRERLRMLIVPGLVLLATLLVWGPDWPLRWIQNREAIELPPWGYATLFPAGLAAFAAIFLFKDTEEQVTAALLASAIGVPWYGVYSYVVFLIFTPVWWIIPVTYAWALAFPWMQLDAMWFNWIVPLSLLLYLVWQNRHSLAIASFRRPSDQGELAPADSPADELLSGDDPHPPPSAA